MAGAIQSFRNSDQTNALDAHVHRKHGGYALEMTVPILSQEQTNRVVAIRAVIDRWLKALHEHEVHLPISDRVGRLLNELGQRRDLV
jgi:hypothetical protein